VYTYRLRHSPKGFTAAVLAALVWFSGPSNAQSSANLGVVEIDDPGRYSQVLAVSDVHGEYAHLKRLLTAARVIDAQGRWAAGRSLLIVVGDSIDKGPESLPILELWMRLRPQAQAGGGRLLVLLGNHEAEFLADPHTGKTKPFRKELKQANIDAEQLAAGRDPRGIGAFLRAMPCAARVGKMLFVHAGWFPPGETWPAFVRRARQTLAAGRYGDPFLTGEHSILEAREVTPAGSDDPEKWYDDAGAVRNLEKRVTGAGLYGVVFGHQPKAFHFLDEIGGVDGLRLIKIDTGMAPDADESPGEVLRFRRPADLLHLARPQADRLLATGAAAQIAEKHVAQ